MQNTIVSGERVREILAVKDCLEQLCMNHQVDQAKLTAFYCSDSNKAVKQRLQPDVAVFLAVQGKSSVRSRQLFCITSGQRGSQVQDQTPAHHRGLSLGTQVIGILPFLFLRATAGSCLRRVLAANHHV